MAIEAFPALAELVISLVIAFWRIAQLFVLLFCASGHKELHLYWFMLQRSTLPSPSCHILLCEIFLILFICPFFFFFVCVCVCVYLDFTCVFSRPMEISLKHRNILFCWLSREFGSSSIAKVTWGKTEAWTPNYFSNSNWATHSTFLIHFYFVKFSST